MFRDHGVVTQFVRIEVCVCTHVHACASSQIAVAQRKVITPRLWGQGRRRKMKELFVPSVRDPLGENIENIPLALGKISAVYTRLVPGTALSVEARDQVWAHLYPQLTL